MSVEPATPPSRTEGPEGPLLPVRVHDLLVTLLGRYVFPLTGAVYSGTFIEVLKAAGIGAYTTRSALSRAHKRGLLDRRHIGKRSYYSITPRLYVRLESGEPYIYERDPVLQGWRGDWSMLSFSLPEDRRDDRHRLRVRLAWAGFGLLRDALWLAPGRRSLEELVGGLDIDQYVTLFHGRVVPPQEAAKVVRQAWDLERAAAGYHSFLGRWDVDEPLPGAPDALTKELYLVTDWRLLLREASPLPAELLPEDWPAQRAAEVFRSLHRRYRDEADAHFERALDLVVDDQYGR